MLTINEAEEILKHDYHRDNFLFIINDILLPDFMADVHEVSFNSHLFSYVQMLGHSTDCNLSVFEIGLNKACEKRRVQITQEMFKILRGLRISNAVVSFVNFDKENYRISLLTSKYEFSGEKVVQVLSNPRRYSYSLGYGTKTKTAYRYLISKGCVHNLEELIERFSIEVVNKQFYTEISTCFTELIGGNRNGKKYKRLLSLKNVDDQNKYAEFGVRLIGRILFCWFLRKKVSEEGTPLLPSDYFEEFRIWNSDNYYNEVLEPLFFELLNTNQRRRRGVFSSEEFKKIPYLNGGLFSPHADDIYVFDKANGCGQQGNVVIPNDWFLNLYCVLNEYNFTVDENTSYDIELSIDPEMLGRIFENLLAEINPETGENAKKSTGSFYTPRGVVDYMVDNSLLQYLFKKTRIKEDALKSLISYSKIDDSFELSDSDKILVIDALYSITILDPACGSGAFPVGMLQKIVYILETLDPDAKLWLKKTTQNISPLLKNEIENKFNSGSLNYIRKLSVIQNSIFGSDIQPIAVEISRLRCFLSLIIEEKVCDNEPNRGINPLPNLDFKFIIANSLVGLERSDEGSLFEDNSDIEQLKTLREEYFSADSERRNELKLEFANIQQNMLLNNIDNYKTAASNKYYQLSAWKPFTNEPTNWFDPDWMFGISDGFDIVIGNPPYIGTGSRNTSDRMDFNEKEYYRKTYIHSAEYKINVYALFMELAINLTKDGGVSTYIVPDSFLLGMYFSKIRSYILEKCNIKYIAILGSDVFSACVGYSVVYMFEKSKPNEDAQMTFIKANNNEGIVDDKIRFSYPQNYAKKLNRCRFRIFFDERTKNLIDKIEKGSTSLGRSYSGHTGVRSKIGQKQIVAVEQISPTYKKGIISGSQVLPYKVVYDGDWINIDPTILNAGGWDEYIISHPKIFVRQTADTLIAALDRNGYYHLNNVHSFSPTQFLWDIRYILALMNSKLMKWYYETLANEKGRPMPQTDIETLEMLPIKSDSKLEEKICAQIDLIEETDDEETICAIAEKIDRFVYEIYGMTKEDIELINTYE